MGYGLGLDRNAGVADEAAANLIEISGIIKWFDVSKGFGFRRSRQWDAGHFAPRDLPAARRIPDRL